MNSLNVKRLQQSKLSNSPVTTPVKHSFPNMQAYRRLTLHSWISDPYFHVYMNNKVQKVIFNINPKCPSNYNLSQNFDYRTQSQQEHLKKNPQQLGYLVLALHLKVYFYRKRSWFQCCSKIYFIINSIYFLIQYFVSLWCFSPSQFVIIPSTLTCRPS